MSYATNGTTGPFAVPFPFIAAAHLKVTLVSALAVETVLTLNVDYTVVVGGSNGTISCTTPYASGSTLVIEREVPATQELDLRDGDEFPPESVEQAFDKLTMLVQQARSSLRRAILVPEISADLPALPIAALRASRVLAFDSLGNPSVLVPEPGTAAAVLLDLADVDEAKGDALLQVKRTAVNSVARSLHAWNDYTELHAMRDFGAVGDGTTDDTAVLQSFVNACALLKIRGNFGAPNPSFKITTPLAISGSCHLRGESAAVSIVDAWGCDAFDIGADFVTIENLQLRSKDSGGTFDPKTHKGIDCTGTTGTHRNNFTARNLYLRGWLYCVDWQYTWQSRLENVDTINCANGVRLFGQSVNNTISGCRLIANGGNASILTVKDGATQGEGLSVDGTLCALGDYGVKSDGWLSMSIDSSIIDLIANIGVDVTNVAGLMISTSWVYAQNFGVKYNTLGALQVVGGSIANSYISAVASASRGIYFGANNKGLTVIGGYVECGTGASRCIYHEGSGGDAMSVVGVYLNNPGSSASIFVVGTNFKHAALQGVTSIEWNGGVPTGQGVIAYTKFAGASGTAGLASGCSVTRNGTGDYTITFSSALAAAQYVPQILARRTSKTAVSYEFTTIGTDSFRFTVVDQAGTAFDPTDVFVTVHN